MAARNATIYLHVGLPAPLYEWLKREAAADNVSMAAALRRILSRQQRDAGGGSS